MLLNSALKFNTQKLNDAFKVGVIFALETAIIRGS